MQTTSVLCNMRSAHAAPSVRDAQKVRKQRRLTEQLGLKAGLKNDLKTARIQPRSSGSTAPSHSGRHRSIPPVIHPPCSSIKLICSSPGFAVLNHHTFLFPWHLVPTSARQRSRSREPVNICAACVSTSLKTQGSVSTLRTLDF